MMAGMIGQHMKLAGGKGNVSVFILRANGLMETQAVVRWQGTAEYSEQRRPDGGAAERIDHSAKRRGVTSSWVMEREEVWIYKMLLSCGFSEPMTVHAHGCFHIYGV